MIACTSPASTRKSMARKMGLPSTLTWRFLISSMVMSADTPFQTYAEQFLRLDREFHRQLLEDLLAESIHDHRDGVFGRKSALHAVEQLILADARCRGFVLDLRRGVLHLDVGERMRRALVAEQERIALRVIARAHRALRYLYQPPIGILAASRSDALGNNRAARVLAEVRHLRAGVGLLIMVGQRDRVELAHRVVALQHDTRVLPRDRRTGLHLRPRNLRIGLAAVTTLGDEVVDAALAFLVARVPVLHRRILDLRTLERDQLDDGGMELVLIAHRRRTAFQITDVCAFVGDDQRAFELTRVLRVDAEISG